MEAAHMTYVTAPSILLNQGGKDAYTKLLLHCDGADGGVVFTDSSATGRTITTADDAEIDTAQKKFGSGSAYFDGTGDYLSAADSADWYMGTDPFTIDLWFRMTSYSATVGFFRQKADDDNYVVLNKLSATFSFSIVSSGVQTVLAAFDAGGGIFQTNTWHHLAAIRGWGGVANAWVVCFDGAAGDVTTDADPWPNLAAAFEIGRHQEDVRFMGGWMDEFRVSKGIARWTANFTPPTGPYIRLYG